MSPTPQMDVLYMQGFGHVLGIFTRAAEPSQIETDVSGFVGDGLHLRGSPPFPIPTPPPFVMTQDLVISPNLIGLYRTARNWRQVFAPFTLTAQFPPNPTGPVSPTAVIPFPSVVAPTASIGTPPNLTVSVSTAVSIATTILILLQDTSGGPTIPLTGYQILATKMSVDVPVNGLNSGDTYNAFLFIPMFPIGVAQFTAP